MEFKKFVNLLDTTSDDKDLLGFVTKKWIEVYDQQEVKITMLKKRIKTPMLRSYLYDFNDGYIVVKGEITVTELIDARRKKSVAFKNNAHKLHFKDRWCAN